MSVILRLCVGVGFGRAVGPVPWGEGTGVYHFDADQTFVHACYARYLMPDTSCCREGINIAVEGSHQSGNPPRVAIKVCRAERNFFPEGPLSGSATYLEAISSQAGRSSPDSTINGFSHMKMRHNMINAMCVLAQFYK